VEVTSSLFYHNIITFKNILFILVV